MSRVERPVRVLALGGLEPSGQAGLLADVEAARALGALPFAVATALTAQGKRTFAVQGVSAQVLRRQLAALRELSPIDAVKLGMVPDVGALRAIARGLEGLSAPWVVDPVVRTSLGRRLSTLTRADYLGLAGPRVVLTPNLAEAAWLAGVSRRPDGPLGAAKLGAWLVGKGFRAVVVKGGHARGEPADVVCTREGAVVLRDHRLPREGARGTGCRFATSLAVALARGEDVVEAAEVAKQMVRRHLVRGMVLG